MPWCREVLSKSETGHAEGAVSEELEACLLHSQTSAGITHLPLRVACLLPWAAFLVSAALQSVVAVRSPEWSMLLSAS